MAVVSNLDTSEGYEFSDEEFISTEGDQISEPESFENPGSPLLPEKNIVFSSFEKVGEAKLRKLRSDDLLEKNIVLKLKFERREYKLWVLMTVINFSAILVSGVADYFLYCSHVRNKPFFDIIDGYDGGKVEQAFLIVMSESGIVFSLGVIVTLGKFLGDCML